MLYIVGLGLGDERDITLRGLDAVKKMREGLRRSLQVQETMVNDYSFRNWLAIPVGIEQKDNVDAIVQKRILRSFYSIMMATWMGDGILLGSNEAIHIVAQNQTKWWFTKRFSHPDVVSIYDYISLWDEDLGVKNFNPGRYLKKVKREGLEISQPALDTNSTDIHHRFTIRSRTKRFHRKVCDLRGSTKCSDASEGPPCTGFVEGMAPVFSKAACHCTWYLIQNGLVHERGMDMKLGYCARASNSQEFTKLTCELRLGGNQHGDFRFSRRNRAVEEDENRVDPFPLKTVRRLRKRNRNQQ